MTHERNILDMPTEYFTGENNIEVEQKERPLIIKILFQLLVFVVVMLAILFAYRFINKIDFSSLYTAWVNSSKVETKVVQKSKDTKKIKINNVIPVKKEMTPSKIRNKQEIHEIVQKVMITMKKNKQGEATKSLDPAYIELIKKSLGKN